jgi:putative ABC transport system permease protein
MRIVTPNFLPTLGVKLLAGRQLSDQDVATSPPVALVDDVLAHRYWPHGSALGRRITYDGAANPKAQWIEIVGVVEHTTQEGLDGERRTQVYLPLAQSGRPNLQIAVRTRGEPHAAVAAVRAAVHDVDADLPLSRIRSMDEMMDASTGPRRFSMILLGIFAGVALTLAAIGLYGVMSYSVTQRSRELGIRIALGARVADILRMVVRQGLALAVTGMGVGLVAALLVTRLIKSMLFGVPATDLVTFGGMVALLLVVALVACYLPARRATRVDPVVALRAE